jgi:hypothetical protein
MASRDIWCVRRSSGTLTEWTNLSRRTARTTMAKRKRKKATRTADDDARWDENTRRLRERIAYHSEMSRLLGERERELRRLEELRRAVG